MTSLTRMAALALALGFSAMLAEPALAQGAADLSNSKIEFAYFPPKSEKFLATLDNLKAHQVLEQLSQFLSPLKLPHKFYLVTNECGRVNAFYSSDLRAIVLCYEFVDFVERGITSGRALLGLASGYLEPLQQASVDTLVLGCTHYPLLAGVIGLVMGDSVTLVSSADETAKDVYRVLNELDLFRPDDASPPEHRFLATGDPAVFARLAYRFLGPEAAASAGVLSQVAQ